MLREILAEARQRFSGKAVFSLEESSPEFEQDAPSSPLAQPAMHRTFGAIPRREFAPRSPRPSNP